MWLGLTDPKRDGEEQVTSGQHQTNEAVSGEYAGRDPGRDPGESPGGHTSCGGSARTVKLGCRQTRSIDCIRARDPVAPVGGRCGVVDRHGALVDGVGWGLAVQVFARVAEALFRVGGRYASLRSVWGPGPARASRRHPPSRGRPRSHFSTRSRGRLSVTLCLEPLALRFAVLFDGRTIENLFFTACKQAVPPGQWQSMTPVALTGPPLMAPVARVA